MLVLFLASLAPSAGARVVLVHLHRPGCNTARCDHWADKRWNEAQARARRRREARELAEGWAIPAPIVMCESGGTNEPPNSAGAAGYYQLTEWSSKSAGLAVDHAGYASDHTRREQGVVARHLYDEQGTGPWVSSEPCWAGRV